KYSGFGEDQPTTLATRFADPEKVPNAGTVNISVPNYNLRYAGQYFDVESGLNYNYFRTYDSRSGRYVSADPIGLEGGWNRFGYVSGNSLRYTDRYGLAEYSGLPQIEGHLRWLAGIQGADFDKDPFDAPNREMLSRLRRGEESPWDIAFYRHEMAEANLCKPARRLPIEEALRVQKQSHESVMRDQQNRERDLYHPDVVFRNRGVFGKDW
ncbi:MAG: RHS repeat-associated core domain-containing protein, partial [Gammaproteobacteria bacterium]|nr:RHS repeat-associated core domain-containing protein [Gammaproteobacteria bacterium]